MIAKQLQKMAIRAGWVVVASGLIPSYARAQEMITEKKKETNSLKVTVDLSVKACGDFLPYDAQPEFMSSAIPAKRGASRQRVLFGTGDLDLGIEKTVPFMSKTIRCALKADLDQKGVSLKRVYADHDSFLVGLYFSNLSDVDALPETLTGDVPCSAVAPSTPQISWKGQFGKGLSCLVGIEQALHPKEDELGHNLAPIKNFSALASSVKYEGALGYVRLGGLFRMLDYEEDAAKKPHHLPAGGANITSVLKLLPEKTTFKFHVIYGVGIGSYILDFAGISKTDYKDIYLKEDQTPALIGTWGGHAAIEHRWLPQLRSTMAYGMLNTERQCNTHGDPYKQGQFASANLTYHPTEQTTLGVEYLWGMRESIAKDSKRHAHRVQAAVGFSL
ncbi:MAG: hypothetical protein ROO73_00520 [Roseivirga sp.]